jgi:hypothetical protein
MMPACLFLGDGDLCGGGGWSHLWQSHSQHPVLKRSIHIVFVCIRRKANGPRHTSIATLNAVAGAVLDVEVSLAVALDDEVVVLHTDVKVFLIHSRKIRMHLELVLHLNEIHIENWIEWCAGIAVFEYHKVALGSPARVEEVVVKRQERHGLLVVQEVVFRSL